MTPEEQLAEMHADVKSILNERLPSIDNRLTKIETRDSVLKGLITSVWGAVAGAFSAMITQFMTGGRHS